MNQFDGLTDDDGLVDLEIQLIEALAAAQGEKASISFVHQLNPAYTAQVLYQEEGWWYTASSPGERPVRMAVRSRPAGIKAALDDGFDVAFVRGG